jgi:surface antigen
MGLQTQVSATAGSTPSPSPTVPRAWWAAGGAALLIAAVLGGLAGAALQGRGRERVCDANDVATHGLPSVVTVQAQGAGGAGTGPARSSAVTAT